MDLDGTEWDEIDWQVYQKLIMNLKETKNECAQTRFETPDMVEFLKGNQTADEL